MGKKNALSKRRYDQIKNERVTVIRFDETGRRCMTYGGVDYRTAVEEVMEATRYGQTAIILTKAQIVNKKIDVCKREQAYFRKAIQAKPYINQTDVAFKEFAKPEETYYILDCKYVRGRETWILEPNYIGHDNDQDGLIAVDNQYKIVATGLTKENYYDELDEKMNEYWKASVR